MPSSVSAASNSGRLVIISGPSGVGKTTVVDALVAQLPDALRSVTVTTRKRRKGEQPGEDYIFVSEEEFMQRVEAGEFLEHTHVFGLDWYGTPKAETLAAVTAGKTVFLIIDVVGGKKIKRQIEDALLIFLLPPSLEELADRLRQRGLDDESAIATRLKRATEEITVGRSEYDYCVLNDDLDTAITEITNCLKQ